MDRQKKTFQHNLTGRECRGDMRGLAGIPWVAGKMPKGYVSDWSVLMRRMGSKPQHWLPSLQNQTQKGIKIIPSY